ncbi:MAG: glmZ(sRNA)-inactivating NTPase [Bacteroidetes bacterium ADurb.Bin408]|nr:MAG: glmZ(sRNA)-inactivating NTPase [Bacteroidetes bacterium ADurb.Bin408]
MLTIHILSFSYKKGLPVYNNEHGGGFIFDCRGLPNPGRIDAYKELTGLDKDVADCLEDVTETNTFLKAITTTVSVNIDNYIDRGFSYLSIAFGCTGGQHRSVYCANKLAEILQQKYPVIEIEVKHRELV